MQKIPHRLGRSFRKEFLDNLRSATTLDFDYPRPVPAMLYGIGMVFGGYAAFGIGAWTPAAAGVNDAPTLLLAANTGAALSFAVDAFLLPAYRTTWANRLLINPFVVAPLTRGFTYLKRKAIGATPA